MWRKPAEAQPSPSPGEFARPAAPPADAGAAEPPRTASAGAAATHIGKSLSIRGEVSSRDDVFLDGTLEGAIRLTGSRLTVGEAGRVRADVEAREVEVHGEINGTVLGQQRVRIGHRGRVAGDIVTQRLAVEEGALIRGNVDVGRAGEKAEPRTPKVERRTQKPDTRPAPPEMDARKMPAEPLTRDVETEQPKPERPAATPAVQVRVQVPESQAADENGAAKKHAEIAQEAGAGNLKA